MADESKTEKATAKKRRDERKKGNVRMSRDVNSVASLMGTLVMLKLMSGVVTGRAKDAFATCFSFMQSTPAARAPDVLRPLFYRFIMTAAIVAGPFLFVTALIAIVATFWQTRMLVTTDPLKPKLSRINPIQGFKRMFSLGKVVETLKNLLKISILLYLIYSYFRNVMVTFARFLEMELPQMCSLLFDDVFNLLLRVVIAFIAVAVADYFYQWWEYERKLKMTKQEVKEEFKQIEGDPKIKSKIRQIQLQRAQQRMMQQVPGADVVIRNPTHVAVALRYKPDEDEAPVVVAMGLDTLALRIVQVAEENGVTVVENVQLARSLYAHVELNRQIPPEFYGPVAEILVYVLKLDRES